MKATIAIIAAAALAGCATAPADIAPTYVSPNAFAVMSCQQMNAEAAAISNSLASLIGQQQQAANNDAALTAATILIFWPAAFFISGGTDNAPQISSLRGQADALMAAAVAKGC